MLRNTENGVFWLIILSHLTQKMKGNDVEKMSTDVDSILIALYYPVNLIS